MPDKVIPLYGYPGGDFGREDDHVVYVGGTRRVVIVDPAADMGYLHLLSEVTDFINHSFLGGAIEIKYRYPAFDLDSSSLVNVFTDEDVKNMLCLHSISDPFPLELYIFVTTVPSPTE